jgi:hypothetical protein
LSSNRTNGQGPHVDLLARSIRLRHAQLRVKGRGLLDVAAVSVLIALAGDIAGEGIAAIAPPETGAVVVIERQHLVGEYLADPGLDREIADRTR